MDANYARFSPYPKPTVNVARASKNKFEMFMRSLKSMQFPRKALFSRANSSLTSASSRSEFALLLRSLFEINPDLATSVQVHFESMKDEKEKIQNLKAEKELANLESRLKNLETKYLRATGNFNLRGAIEYGLSNYYDSLPAEKKREFELGLRKSDD
ncbi:hypothetical protein HK098_000944 [Nowakowskiella sp. JEL0407]|nr:hypothetical protein HK098_000944 [Nowakowskiella sp. JEL0407]